MSFANATEHQPPYVRLKPGKKTHVVGRVLAQPIFVDPLRVVMTRTESIEDIGQLLPNIRITDPGRKSTDTKMHNNRGEALTVITDEYSREGDRLVHQFGFVIELADTDWKTPFLSFLHHLLPLIKGRGGQTDDAVSGLLSNLIKRVAALFVRTEVDVSITVLTESGDDITGVTMVQLCPPPGVPYDKRGSHVIFGDSFEDPDVAFTFDHRFRRAGVSRSQPPQPQTQPTEGGGAMTEQKQKVFPFKVHASVENFEHPRCLIIWVTEGAPRPDQVKINGTINQIGHQPKTLENAAFAFDGRRWEAKIPIHDQEGEASFNSPTEAFAPFTTKIGVSEFVAERTDVGPAPAGFEDLQAELTAPDGTDEPIDGLVDDIDLETDDAFTTEDSLNPPSLQASQKPVRVVKLPDDPRLGRATTPAPAAKATMADPPPTPIVQDADFEALKKDEEAKAAQKRRETTAVVNDGRRPKAQERRAAGTPMLPTPMPKPNETTNRPEPTATPPAPAKRPSVPITPPLEDRTTPARQAAPKPPDLPVPKMPSGPPPEAIPSAIVAPAQKAPPSPPPHTGEVEMPDLTKNQPVMAQAAIPPPAPAANPVPPQPPADGQQKESTMPASSQGSELPKEFSLAGKASYPTYSEAVMAAAQPAVKTVDPAPANPSQDRSADKTNGAGERTAIIAWANKAFSAEQRRTTILFLALIVAVAGGVGLGWYFDRNGWEERHAADSSENVELAKKVDVLQTKYEEMDKANKKAAEDAAKQVAAQLSSCKPITIGGQLFPGPNDLPLVYRADCTGEGCTLYTATWRDGITGPIDKRRSSDVICSRLEVAEFGNN